MAEDVQAALDEMVPALKDLQDRGVFTSDEIHQIVDRRRTSEYDIRRPKDSRKADFLRYIQSEVDLEKLRRLRTKKFRRERKEDPDADVDSRANKIGDVHILNHIHSLWKRTLVKFGKSDVSLYLQYAEFCKEIRALAALSRTLADALRLFPLEEALWIEATSHEFFELGSIQNARVLMQQGLRLQEQSQDLWLQFFTLELHFVERIKARRQILLGDNMNSENANKTTARLEESAGKLKTLQDEEETWSEEDPHKIPRLVYKNAVLAIPDIVAFRLKFWDQCRLFSNTLALQKFIVDSIRNDLCQKSAEAWMAWALFQWENKEKMDAQLKQDFANEDDERENRKIEQNSTEEKVVDCDDTKRKKGDGSKNHDGDTVDQVQKEAGKKRKKNRSGVEDGDAGDQDQHTKERDLSEEKVTDSSRKRKKRSSDNEDHASDQDHNVSEKIASEGSRLSQDQMEGYSSVLDVLRQATLSLPTEEMYLKAIRMITRYIASLQEQQQDDPDPDIAAGVRILEIMFEEAEKSAFYSAELAMEQALFLSRCGRKEESAPCLEKFTDSHPAEDALKVWIHLAEISDNPIPVLTKALNKTETNHPTHYELLFHLFGAKLQAKDDSDLSSLFDKIVLLTPGFLPIREIEEPIFGVRHALDACLQYLRLLNEKKEIEKARKVYKTVLMSSSLGSIFSEFDDDALVLFIDEAVDMEKNSATDLPKKRLNHIVQLCDQGAKLFGNSEMGKKYEERQREAKLCNW